MSHLQLFHCSNEVLELHAKPVDFERDLQVLIEKNMKSFFEVRFLQSEFSISNGRIDSLGLDENNCPVIFEYKRSSNENVVNQGLFYLDWLLDHKADFEKLVMKIINSETSNIIDWTMPQVICIASDFNKYDRHAVNQMHRNIKLVRYRKYDNNLILFEHLNTPEAKPIEVDRTSSIVKSSMSQKLNFTQMFDVVPSEMQNLYLSIKNYILSLGDDVTENQLKFYVAFKKIRNIVCVEVFKNRIILHLAIDPKTVELKEGFTRDMSNTGHYGTGDLEILVKSSEDFENAKPLIERAYNEN